MLKIYITGMPKGGTTLTKSLFNCFHNTYVVPGDWDVPYYLPGNLIADNVVVKGLKLGKDIPYFKNLGFRSLVVLRDIRDQIASSWSDPSVHGKRYVTTRQGQEMQELLRYFLSTVVPNYDYLEIRYEDICHRPEESQHKIEEYFGLQSRCPFTEGYNLYSNVKDEALEGTDYGALRGGFNRQALRPIDIQSIGQWQSRPCKDFVLEFLEDFPEAKQYLVKYYSEKI